MSRGWLTLALLLTVACGENVTTSDPGAGGAGGGSSSGSGSGTLSNVLEGAQLGDPHLLSAQRLAFGPGGVLLIGDGRSERIVAVETGDTSEAAREDNSFNRIDNLPGLAADAIGPDVASDDVVIEDVAVNPSSFITYIAATRTSTNEAYVLWVDADADLRLFDMSNVVHAAVDVRPSDGAAALIADLIWFKSSVIATVTPQSFLRHEITYVATPFEHEGGARHTTTRIFHRSWNQWITEQPMDAFFTFENAVGQRFLAGSFTSSVAVFEASELADGSSEEPGETVFDLLDGRWVLDFEVFQRDDEMRVLLSVMNLLFDGEAKGIVLSEALFTEPEGTNEDAPILFDFAGLPLVDGIELAFSLNDARRFSLRGDSHVVVLRGNRLETELLPP